MGRLSWFLLIVGSAALILAAVLWVREISFLGGAELITGKVTSYTAAPGSSSEYDGQYYCPVVSFTAANDETVKYQSNVCTAPPKYQLGERVTLYYNAASGKTQVKGFSEQYLGVLTLGVVWYVVRGVRLADAPTQAKKEACFGR